MRALLRSSIKEKLVLLATLLRLLLHLSLEDGFCLYYMNKVSIVKGFIAWCLLLRSGVCFELMQTESRGSETIKLAKGYTSVG